MSHNLLHFWPMLPIQPTHSARSATAAGRCRFLAVAAPPSRATDRVPQAPSSSLDTSEITSHRHGEAKERPDRR